MRKWLDKERESLPLHRHLTKSAQEWQRRGHEAGELYRGTRLQQIQEWMKGDSQQLSLLEGEFLKASLNVKRQERFRLAVLASGVVILLLVALLGVRGQLNPFIYRPVDMDDYWVTIPAGEFQMGSEYGETDELPVHTVHLDEYQIGKFEVTNRQYAQCEKVGICRRETDTGVEKELHPVVNVLWDDARVYCEWVGGRLPTEAEWEKAASWDDQTKTKRTYPWGETIDCSYVNYSGEDSAACVGDTTPVGSYESGRSPYGLYDMAGNASEWVNDWYGQDYYASSPHSNPLGPDHLPDARLLRGGAWRNEGDDVRSTKRDPYFPMLTSDLYGFRCSRGTSP